jgi:hypothetical protein
MVGAKSVHVQYVSVCSPAAYAARRPNIINVSAFMLKVSAETGFVLVGEKQGFYQAPSGNKQLMLSVAVRGPESSANHEIEF